MPPRREDLKGRLSSINYCSRPVPSENLIRLDSVTLENRIMIFGKENIHLSGVDLVPQPVQVAAAA